MSVTEKLYRLAEDRAERMRNTHAPETSNTMALKLAHEANAYTAAAQEYEPYQYSGILTEPPVEYTTKRERLVRGIATAGLFVAAMMLGYIVAVVVFSL